MRKQAKRNSNHTQRNREYEQRQNMNGLVRLSVWVPEADSETFKSAARTYVERHKERVGILPPSG